MENKNDIKTGKFLSLILRHHPETIGIKLDKNGWADVEELINGIRKSEKKIDIIDLKRIVQNNDKKRYSFNEDFTKIRANQGHSINVDVELKQCCPPEYLYHGTAEKYINKISKEGIKKQSRQFVHLSNDIYTAEKVGIRHGKVKVLKIMSDKMYNNGYKFYLSENNIWLTEYIPTDYIIFQ